MKQEMFSRCNRCNQGFNYTRNGLHGRLRTHCDVCKTAHRRDVDRERKSKQRQRERMASLRNAIPVNQREQIMKTIELRLKPPEMSSGDFWRILKESGWVIL